MAVLRCTLRNSQYREPALRISPLTPFISILVLCPQPSLIPRAFFHSVMTKILRKMPSAFTELLQESYLKIDFGRRIKTSHPKITRPSSHLLLSPPPITTTCSAQWCGRMECWAGVGGGCSPSGLSYLSIIRHPTHDCWKAHPPPCAQITLFLLSSLLFLLLLFVNVKLVSQIDSKLSHFRSLFLTINLEVIMDSIIF